ncbi:hypothetical protein QZH41_016502 [Actinostola sp. cb2023]|nr:hypothetical protein QZH41_016502 [Actinostola sp. cb2023]
MLDFYRKKKSATAVQDLWEYLESILDSLKSHHERQITSCASLTLMPQLLQVFIDVLSSGFDQNDIALIALHCGQMILSNSTLNIAFLAKYENYILFLSSLLTTFVSLLNRHTVQHETINKELFCLLEIALNLYIPLQRRQTNHKKLFERACQHLLEPLVSACHLLKDNDKVQSTSDVSQDRINVLIGQLHQALSDALFRKEHLPEYPISLKALDIEVSTGNDTQEPKAKKARVGNYTKELFVTLRTHCSQVHYKNAEKVSREALGSFLPQMFIEFLKARRCNKFGPSTLEFEFFREMCSLLGISFKDGIHSTATSNVLGLVYTLLDTLLTYDVYQVADDNANGRIQFKWFNSFVDLLIKAPSSYNVFQCLQVLLQLNHYIIEPHLTTLLQHCWMDDDIKCNKDMSSRDLFLSSLLKTYAKLRQFDKFIIKMLQSLQATANIDSTWHGLPKQFKDELIKACQSLPYGLATFLHVDKSLCQSLPYGLATLIWKTFNKEILGTYLPCLQAFSVKKEHSDSSEQEKRCIYSFERVIGLLRVFLLNTTFGGVAEQHKTDAIIRNLTELSHVLDTEILGPILDVLPKIADHKLNESTSASALILYHTLQEVNVFLGKFGLISAGVNSEITTLHWVKHLRSHVQQDVKKKGHERLVYIKVLIAIQRIRICLRPSAPLCTAIEDKELFDFVFQWHDRSSCHSFTSWNQQLWSVDNSTFGVAYWFTLCNNVPILLRMCSAQHQKHFVQYLIHTLLPSNQDSKLDMIHYSSRTLLHNAHFHQISSIQKCFVVSLWNGIAQLSRLVTTLPSSNLLQKKLLEVMMIVGTLDVQGDEGYDGISEEDDSEDESASEEESEEHVSSQGQKANEIPSTVTPLASAGKMLDCVLQRISAGEKLDVIDSETARDISQRTSLLSFLPLDWLTDISHVGCVLGILACDALADNRLHQGDDDADQLQDVSIKLLGVLMRYTLKIASPMTVIAGFMKELIKKVDCLTNKLKDESKASNKTLKHDHSLLRICGAVMNVLEQVIAHKTSRLNEVKMAVHLFSQLSPPILALLQVITRSSKKTGTKEKSLDDKTKDVTLVLQDHYVLIDVYTAVVHVYCISQTSRKLSRSKEEFQELSWRPILAPFLKFAIDSFILTKQHDLPETTTNDNNNGGIKVRQFISHASTMTSSLHFLDVIVSSLDILDLDLPKGFHSHLLASILSFLNHLDESHNELKRIALDVVLSLVQGCSSEMVVDLLTGLSNELIEVIQSVISQTVPNPLDIIITISIIVITIISITAIITIIITISIITISIISIIVIINHHVITIITISITAIITIIITISITAIITIITISITAIITIITAIITISIITIITISIIVIINHHVITIITIITISITAIITIIITISITAIITIIITISITAIITIIITISITAIINHHVITIITISITAIINHHVITIITISITAIINHHVITIITIITISIIVIINQLQNHIPVILLSSSTLANVLVPGIYCLIDSCGEHEIALLHAVLDKGSRELFTSLTNEYNKFYKFKGKA